MDELSYNDILNELHQLIEKAKQGTQRKEQDVEDAISTPPIDGDTIGAIGPNNNDCSASISPTSTTGPTVHATVFNGSGLTGTYTDFSGNFRGVNCYPPSSSLDFTFLPQPIGQNGSIVITSTQMNNLTCSGTTGFGVTGIGDVSFTQSQGTGRGEVLDITGAEIGIHVVKGPSDCNFTLTATSNDTPSGGTNSVFEVNNVPIFCSLVDIRSCFQGKNADTLTDQSLPKNE